MTTNTPERRPRRADPLKGTGLAVRPHKTPARRKCYVLCWTVGGYYRSRTPLAVSKFAWVRPLGAAARFSTRAAARQCALDYIDGLDTVDEHQRYSPSPEDFIYPQRAASRADLHRALG